MSLTHFHNLSGFAISQAKLLMLCQNQQHELVVGSGNSEDKDLKHYFSAAQSSIYGNQEHSWMNLVFLVDESTFSRSGESFSMLQWLHDCQQLAERSKQLLDRDILVHHIIHLNDPLLDFKTRLAAEREEQNVEFWFGNEQSGSNGKGDRLKHFATFSQNFTGQQLSSINLVRLSNSNNWKELGAILQILQQRKLYRETLMGNIHHLVFEFKPEQMMKTETEAVEQLYGRLCDSLSEDLQQRDTVTIPYLRHVVDPSLKTKFKANLEGFPLSFIHVPEVPAFRSSFKSGFEADLQSQLDAVAEELAIKTQQYGDHLLQTADNQAMREETILRRDLMDGQWNPNKGLSAQKDLRLHEVPEERTWLSQQLRNLEHKCVKEIATFPRHFTFWLFPSLLFFCHMLFVVLLHESMGFWYYVLLMMLSLSYIVAMIFVAERIFKSVRLLRIDAQKLTRTQEARLVKLAERHVEKLERLLALRNEELRNEAYENKRSQIENQIIEAYYCRAGLEDIIGVSHRELGQEHNDELTVVIEECSKIRNRIQSTTVMHENKIFAESGDFCCFHVKHVNFLLLRNE